MRDDEVFGGLGDEARDVLVALVSCGGHVIASDLAPAATAWAAANGRALESFDDAVYRRARRHRPERARGAARPGRPVK
ncbi:MAG TPA: hypothetical protein VNQ77_12900 [Frankiaceae bacterium]|nr:hypothetical protein [Frankiaceae bacterium]